MKSNYVIITKMAGIVFMIMKHQIIVITVHERRGHGERNCHKEGKQEGIKGKKEGGRRDESDVQRTKSTESIEKAIKREREGTERASGR